MSNGLNLLDSKYCQNVEEISPSNTTIFEPCLVYVGVSGDVSILPHSNYNEDNMSGTAVKSDARVLIKNAEQGKPIGGNIPIVCRAILTSGTTATNFVKLKES